MNERGMIYESNVEYNTLLPTLAFLSKSIFFYGFMKYLLYFRNTSFGALERAYTLDSQREVLIISDGLESSNVSLDLS